MKDQLTRKETEMNKVTLFLLTITLAGMAMGGHQVDTDLSSEWESTGFNNGRSIVRDADGYFHTVFHSQLNPNSAPGGDCDIYYSHTLVPAPPTSSADWAPAVCIASQYGDDRYPSIAIEHGSTGLANDNDMLHVVWQHKNGQFYDINHISSPNTFTPPPDAWGPISTIWTSTQNSLVPDIDCSFGNILHVVWQEENYNGGLDSEILYSSSYDHGGSWTGVLNISQTPGFNSQMPDVATVIDFPESPSHYTYYSEKVHVVWNDDMSDSPPVILYRAGHNGGTSWDGIENVSLDSGSFSLDGYPSLTVSRDDIPHVVWMHNVYPHDPDDPGPYIPGVDPTNPNCFPGPIAGMYCELNQEIRYSNRTGSVWAPFETITSYAADDEFPSIACDRTDMLHTAWQGCDGSDYEIFQSHRSVSGGPWFGLENISMDSIHDDLFPSEATKKAGTYTEGYDLVWTKIDSNLSSGGHGLPGALSPAHEIWFSGNTIYSPPTTPVQGASDGIVPPGFGVETNPVRSGTWINTGEGQSVVRIFDMSGRIILEEPVGLNQSGLYWSVSQNVPVGTYTVMMERSGECETAKVVVIR